MDFPLLTSPGELGLMHAGENKAKGKKHAALLKANKQLKKAKSKWMKSAKTHMETFYLLNNAQNWSVESDLIDTSPQWISIPAETQVEYLRLHKLALATQAA
jgi:hypothetical protein